MSRRVDLPAPTIPTRCSSRSILSRPCSVKRLSSTSRTSSFTRRSRPAHPPRFPFGAVASTASISSAAFSSSCQVTSMGSPPPAGGASSAWARGRVSVSSSASNTTDWVRSCTRKACSPSWAIGMDRVANRGAVLSSSSKISKRRAARDGAVRSRVRRCRSHAGAGAPSGSRPAPPTRRAVAAYPTGSGGRAERAAAVRRCGRLRTPRCTGNRPAAARHRRPCGWASRSPGGRGPVRRREGRRGGSCRGSSATPR